MCNRAVVVIVVVTSSIAADMCNQGMVCYMVKLTVTVRASVRVRVRDRDRVRVRDRVRGCYTQPYMHKPSLLRLAASMACVSQGYVLRYMSGS